MSDFREQFLAGFASVLGISYSDLSAHMYPPINPSLLRSAALIRASVRARQKGAANRKLKRAIRIMRVTSGRYFSHSSVTLLVRFYRDEMLRERAAILNAWLAVTIKDPIT